MVLSQCFKIRFIKQKLTYPVEEPLDVSFDAPFAREQLKPLRQSSLHVRSIDFRPDDDTASDVLTSQTALGRIPETLQAAHNVRMLPSFAGSIAAFSSLQKLSLVRA